MVKSSRFREVAKDAVERRCISGALDEWAEKHRVHLQCIKPGNPQQKTYVERYKRTLRYDWLRQNLFSRIDEVQGYAYPLAVDIQQRKAEHGAGWVTPAQKLQLAT